MENNQDNTLDLKQITSKCLDSPGYLLFAAILSPNRDKEGRQTVDFQYRRYHFNLEDGKMAARTLKDFVRKEIDDLINQQRDEENHFAD